MLKRVAIILGVLLTELKADPWDVDVEQLIQYQQAVQEDQRLLKKSTVTQNTYLSEQKSQDGDNSTYVLKNNWMLIALGSLLWAILRE